MHLSVSTDYQSLCKATAEIIISYIQQKPNSLICLASGHTPIGVFKEMQEAIALGKLNLSSCHFISLDEWLGIDPADSGSCLSMLNRDCFEPLQLRPDQVHYFDVTAVDLSKECNRINQFISQHGGLDVMLVGVGTNGHIGMNEPGTSFDTYAHIGNLAEETCRVGQKYFNKPTVLNTGITLGLKHLKEARLPIVMASGDAKAKVMAKSMSEPASSSLPVSIVQLIEQGYIMLDDAAARYINSR